MKAICGHCEHEWDMPDDFIARLYPPRGTVAFRSLCGCERCVPGFKGGPFCWDMEDGSIRSALAGSDELEDQGVAVLAHERHRFRK